MDSVFFVTKGVTYIEDKGVYAAALINKRSYWPKEFPCDLINTRFEDNYVGDVGIIEARTEDNKLLNIFFMKELYYVIKTVSSLMKLDELEGARTRREFIDSSGTKDTKQFT